MRIKPEKSQSNSITLDENVETEQNSADLSEHASRVNLKSLNVNPFFKISDSFDLHLQQK